MSTTAKFVSSFGGIVEIVENVKFIATGPGARENARQFARDHGGRVYRAVAVGKVISEREAQNLGEGYIVATTPPVNFAICKAYYAKVTEIQDMSERDRRQYVNDRGIAVFGERKKFLMWLNIPNRALGNKPPDSFMQSISGMQRILDILVQIEHGVYS